MQKKNDEKYPANPDWLTDEISQMETPVEYAGTTVYAYEWQNDYYFEYHNVLSSSLPQPVSAKGDAIHFYVFETTKDYYKEKCCKQYVWRAPKYEEFIR